MCDGSAIPPQPRSHIRSDPPAIARSIMPMSGTARVARSTGASLEPGSLSSPKAGLTYAAGSLVNITWGQAEYHAGRYTLWYSRDGGTTWQSIASWQGPGGDGVTVT